MKKQESENEGSKGAKINKVKSDSSASGKQKTKKWLGGERFTCVEGWSQER